MNLILFTIDEDLNFLSINDKRTKHILEIIKPEVNSTLDYGIVNKEKGKLKIINIDDKGIYFEVQPIESNDEFYPITLIIGTPRPPVAKRLIKDLTTSGVEKIIMCATDLGEKSYLTSNLWKDNNYLENVYEGCSQGESYLVPKIEKYFSLKKALESIDYNGNKIALDNISPDFNISNFRPEHLKSVVVIGGERGFSDREREMLKEFNYNIFKMGNRVLRTETVCHQIVGSILTLSKLI
ncbi:MAG: RNA methyltransferase [Spirochaetales bacterium]|nr:RNA methyltransferase [Spirochaetales bacterium]